ncbi:MAG: TetR/AcrR family transcriptional regulator [Bacteroidota bacterium]
MKAVIKESRADHIIESARTVFFQKGYSSTSISDICKVAGCSRTTLYSYFESKENIYLAVVKKTFNKFLAYFSRLELKEQSGLDRVLNLALGYLEFAQQFPQHYLVILDFYGTLRSIVEATAETEAQSKIRESDYFKDVETLARLPLKLLSEEIANGQADQSINHKATATEHMMNIWAYLKGMADLFPMIQHFEAEQFASYELKATVRQTIMAMIH